MLAPAGGGRIGRTEGLVQALAREGLAAARDDVAWIDPAPGGLHAALTQRVRAVVRARTTGQLHDLYLVRARLSPEGHLLGITSIHDLTRTPGADETAPAVDETHVAYSAVIEGVTTSVYDLDLRGEGELLGGDVTRVGRLENALTNWQDTGQLSGVGRRGWTFDP